MDCIVCKEPMVAIELNQVEIDHCLDCGGVWLDAGELELLLESPQEVKQLLENSSSTGETEESERKCPICFKKMEVIVVGKQSRVLIDRCRQGHGLWFDRGELEDVAAVLSLDQDSKVSKLLQDIFGK